MKKGLLVLFFLISFFAKGQTSVYHPFPDSNAVWGIDKQVISPWSLQFWKIILTNRDTIINTITYHQVDSQLTYYGALRQNISLKRVYFIPSGSSVEQLLFDFNLQAGDTIPPSYGGCYPEVTVGNIDSTNQFGNGYRKVFYLTGGVFAPYSLIEGIGLDGGLFFPYCHNDGYMYHLDCYRLKDSLIYSNAAPWTNCDFPTNISIRSDEILKINISPNPFTNELKIIGATKEDVVLYDVTGKEILRVAGAENFLPQQETKLNTTKIAAGFYLLRVGGKVFKVVKGN